MQTKAGDDTPVLEAEGVLTVFGLKQPVITKHGAQSPIFPVISLYLTISENVERDKPYNVGHLSSIPGSERSPGKENGTPLQYPCLENSKDRGAWLITVDRVTMSQTQVSN